MINAGIIGVTGFGAVHYNDLCREYKNGNVKICAAVIINPEAVPEKIEFLKSVGCEIFSDYELMLQKYAGKLDLCCIPTGIAMHRPMTVAALAAGCNVFVEKPVAPTIEDAEAMEAAAAKAGKFIAVGYQTMYQPETHKIKKILLSGQLGKARRLKCHALWPRTSAYYGRNGWAGHLFSSSGAPILDSPFTNALAHYLNLLLFQAGSSFGKPAEVCSVDAQMLRANPIESCDTAAIHAVTKDGKEILFTISHTVKADEKIDPISEIECEKGKIWYSQQETIVYGADGGILNRFPSADSAETRSNVWKGLFARIQDPAAFICTPEIAKAPLLVSNAVYDCTPVTDVPAAQVEISCDENQVFLRSVRGMAEAVKRSYEEFRMFHTGDFTFAPPVSHLDLNGYHSFERRLY